MATFTDILIVDPAAERPGKAADPSSDRRALDVLAEAMGQSDAAIHQAACSLALRLTTEGSAGVSVVDRLGDPEPCRWACLGGRLVGRLANRGLLGEGADSIVVTARCPALLSEPDRHFEWMLASGVSVREAIVAPLFGSSGKPCGSVWALRHGEGLPFDSEDVRLVEVIARLAGAAIEARRKLQDKASKRTAGKKRAE